MHVGGYADLSSLYLNSTHFIACILKLHPPQHAYSSSTHHSMHTQAPPTSQHALHTQAPPTTACILKLHPPHSMHYAYTPAPPTSQHACMRTQAPPTSQHACMHAYSSSTHLTACMHACVLKLHPPHSTHNVYSSSTCMHADLSVPYLNSHSHAHAHVPMLEFLTWSCTCTRTYAGVPTATWFATSHFTEEDFQLRKEQLHILPTEYLGYKVASFLQHMCSDIQGLIAGQLHVLEGLSVRCAKVD